MNPAASPPHLSVHLPHGFPHRSLDSLLAQFPGLRYIYLTPRLSFTDGGSPRWDSLEELAPAVSLLSQRGARALLSLDYKCFGDYHLVPSSLSALVRSLWKLAGAGLHGLCVSETYLAEALGGELPVHLSWQGGVFHPSKLRYLEELPFEKVTLHPDVNRNEPLLREFARLLGSRAQLVLNSGCFTRCPVELFCRSMEFHCEERPELRKKARELYRRECRGWLRKSPWKIHALPFIPPGCVSFYEEMGYEDFVILPVPGGFRHLSRTLAAYLGREGPFRLSERGVDLEIPPGISRATYFCGHERLCDDCPDCRRELQAGASGGSCGREEGLTR